MIGLQGLLCSPFLLIDKLFEDFFHFGLFYVENDYINLLIFTEFIQGWVSAEAAQ